MRGVTATRLTNSTRNCFLCLIIKDVCTRGGIERRRFTATSTWESRTSTSLIDEANSSPIGSSVAEEIRDSSETFQEFASRVKAVERKGSRTRRHAARLPAIPTTTARRRVKALNPVGVASSQRVRFALRLLEFGIAS